MESVSTIVWTVLWMKELGSQLHLIWNSLFCIKMLFLGLFHLLAFCFPLISVKMERLSWTGSLCEAISKYFQHTSCPEANTDWCTVCVYKMTCPLQQHCDAVREAAAGWAPIGAALSLMPKRPHLLFFIESQQTVTRNVS